MSTMTIDELLAEVAAAYKGDDGLTTLEWAGKMKCGEALARKRLTLLTMAGKIVKGKAPRTSALTGVTQPIAVYRIVT